MLYIVYFQLYGILENKLIKRKTDQWVATGCSRVSYKGAAQDNFGV